MVTGNKRRLAVRAAYITAVLRAYPPPPPRPFSPPSPSLSAQRPTAPRQPPLALASRLGSLASVVVSACKLAGIAQRCLSVPATGLACPADADIQAIVAYLA